MTYRVRLEVWLDTEPIPGGDTMPQLNYETVIHFWTSESLAGVDLDDAIYEVTYGDGCAVGPWERRVTPEEVQAVFRTESPSLADTVADDGEHLHLAVIRFLTPNNPQRQDFDLLMAQADTVILPITHTALTRDQARAHTDFEHIEDFFEAFFYPDDEETENTQEAS